MLKKSLIISLGLASAISASAFSPRNVAKADPRSAKAAADENGWREIGQGQMTDFLLGDLFWTGNTTITVTVEQSTTDVNTYRIQAPYANWNDPSISRYVKFDSSKATPMVIHVSDEGYAWFEEFDTGLDVDLSVSGFPDKGELTVKMWGADLIDEYGVNVVASEGPSALCAYEGGVLTLGAYGTFRKSSSHNILCDIGGKYAASGNYYVANYNGEFKLVLFGDGDVNTPADEDDSENWETIGNAEYTDDLLTLLYGDQLPQYQTYKVEMQQYKLDPTMYRLKNPYAGWKIPWSDVYYDDSKNYYMVIYTIPSYNAACIGDFETGMFLDGMGKMGITTDAYYYSKMYGLDFTLQMMPELFANFKDGEVTYPATIRLEGNSYPSMLAWFGAYSDENLYQVNAHGRFSIKFPTGKEPEENGVDSISSDFGDEEYYTLQGIRIHSPEKGQLLIVKRGSKTEKRIF